MPTVFCSCKKFNLDIDTFSVKLLIFWYKYQVHLVECACLGSVTVVNSSRDLVNEQLLRKVKRAMTLRCVFFGKQSSLQTGNNL